MNADEERDAVDPIVHDLLATLDLEREHAMDLVHAEVDQMREYWTENRSRSFAYELAERVQQVVHDEFIDTSWPPCHRHGERHPLWLGAEEPPNWQCRAADLVIEAPLGRLGSS